MATKLAQHWEKSTIEVDVCRERESSSSRLYKCLNRCKKLQVVTNDILTSTLSELEAIQDFHLTFEVDFIGEMARDAGNPRKE